uniref:(California timema) hypothetical protein n=1 Tax=Timema californicum TaxID=61474 RepID=A0A7R9PB93_TIMCA|nr:unnamed protein product [Timema californicum]
METGVSVLIVYLWSDVSLLPALCPASDPFHVLAEHLSISSPPSSPLPYSIIVVESPGDRLQNRLSLYPRVLQVARGNAQSLLSYFTELSAIFSQVQLHLIMVSEDRYGGKGVGGVAIYLKYFSLVLINISHKTIMGKLKRPRQKYHFSKTKPPKDETPLDTPLLAARHLPLELPSGNIFSGVKITLEHLKQKLPDDDVASVVSSRRSRLDNSGRPTTKKEKIKNRKEAFLRSTYRSGHIFTKLNIAHNLKSETKERKKRQKTAVTGDMRPLLDALPSVSCKERTQTFQSKIKKRSVSKMKQRHKSMLQEILAFQKILSDPTYKADPSGAVTNHIQDKIREEL